MDATQISMGRVMAYLLEVTERFGMATRTELILLQRTMLVVEGVARSLDPSINIWEVSQPVVESYIKENIGPKALARDLGRTAIVLSRFGPRLPQLAEAALTSHLNEKDNAPKATPWKTLGLIVLGGGFAAAIGAATALLFS
jgi:ubiquinone biosynthesis protein